MSIGDDRIVTRVLSGTTIGPDMQPVFIGHCPGKVNLNAVYDDAFLKNRLEQLGYSERVANFSESVSDEEADQLYMLPIPVRSLAQFQRLFPQATYGIESASEQLDTQHWLPWAIKDFFSVGTSQLDDRICWVIRVDETQGVAGFDISSTAVQHLPESWSAIELACSIESVGILVIPDLERLLVPREIQDIARKHLPNPSAEFYPCSEQYDDTHRERRYSDEIVGNIVDESAVRRIQQVAYRIKSWRPGMQWIFSLPPDIENEIAVNKPVEVFDMWLNTVAKNLKELSAVQFVFPLIFSDTRPVTSASGLLAGHIVHKTRSDGVWRSISGMPLSTHLSVWPEVSIKHRTRLREELGLGVLYQAGDNLQLDDERLVVNGFCDHVGTACKSGELMRFVGWLRRSLRNLGEDMIFNLDGRDPAINNILDAFFRELHQQGALRGAQPEDAYRLTNLSNSSKLIHFQIEIAPSFPVDRFVVSFMHDSKANSLNFDWEVAANG